MKKRLIIVLLASAVCGIANAQNEWEEMDKQQEEKEAVEGESRREVSWGSCSYGGWQSDILHCH